RKHLKGNLGILILTKNSRSKSSTLQKSIEISTSLSWLGWHNLMRLAKGCGSGRDLRQVGTMAGRDQRLSDRGGRAGYPTSRSPCWVAQAEVESLYAEECKLDDSIRSNNNSLESLLLLTFLRAESCHHVL
ncbi:hypothetical protein CFOL_v3_25357, partial [Cephalotus follicularis]